MTVTAFPSGVSSYGIPIIGGAGPLGVTTTGQVFFVSSAIGADLGPDGLSQGTNPLHPFKTIAFAIAQCKANNGDVIYVMPGHAETIATATSLAVNVAGIQIIGLGNRNTRPKITFNGTASKIAISAASVTLRNLILVAGIDEVVTAISVTAAFCELDAVDVVETSVKQFIQFVLTSAAADDLIIKNCVHHQSTAPAANSLWIQLIGADRCKILDNQFFITTTNSASSSIIESDTTAPLNILIARNRIVQLGGASVIPVNLMTGTSGYAHDNRVASPATAIAGSIALASCYGAENYCSHVVNKNGILEPVADA